MIHKFHICELDDLLILFMTSKSILEAFSDHLQACWVVKILSHLTMPVVQLRLNKESLCIFVSGLTLYMSFHFAVDLMPPFYAFLYFF